jgi:hypothetical protein
MTIEEKIKQKMDNLNSNLVCLKIELNSIHGCFPNIFYEKNVETKKQIELLELQLLRIKKLNKIS